MIYNQILVKITYLKGSKYKRIGKILKYTNYNVYPEIPFAIVINKMLPPKTYLCDCDWRNAILTAKQSHTFMNAASHSRTRRPKSPHSAPPLCEQNFSDANSEAIPTKLCECELSLVNAKLKAPSRQHTLCHCDYPPTIAKLIRDTRIQ